MNLEKIENKTGISLFVEVLTEIVKILCIASRARSKDLLMEGKITIEGHEFPIRIDTSDLEPNFAQSKPVTEELKDYMGSPPYQPTFREDLKELKIDPSQELA